MYEIYLKQCFKENIAFYVNIKKKFQINNPRFYFKGLEKKSLSKQKEGKNKDLETNYIDNIKQYVLKSMKPKVSSLKRSTKLFYF